MAKIKSLTCKECGAVLLCARSDGEDWLRAGWRYRYIVEPDDEQARELNGWHCHRCDAPHREIDERLERTFAELAALMRTHH